MNKTDIYEPTEAEKRILEVAISPESFNMNIRERYTAAKVAKDTWYKAMGKPGFVELLNSLTMDMLKGSVADVVRATLKYATTDSKCAQDRKVLLTMAGLYTDKKEIDATNINLNKDVTTMTDEDLAAEIERLK